MGLSLEVTMQKLQHIALLFITLTLAMLPITALAEEPLERVEAAYVCMVSDAAYVEEQIRVNIDDKTYYGCCHMCKGRLERNKDLRVATDPVSGKEVDKATAVIARHPTYRNVVYFESEENLEKFNSRVQSEK